MSERSWAYFFIYAIKLVLFVPAAFVIAHFTSWWVVLAIFLWLWSDNIKIPEEYR